jgi:hypothetical protein
MATIRCKCGPGLGAGGLRRDQGHAHLGTSEDSLSISGTNGKSSFGEYRGCPRRRPVLFLLMRGAQRWGLFVVGSVIYRSVLFRPST